MFKILKYGAVGMLVVMMAACKYDPLDNFTLTFEILEDSTNGFSYFYKEAIEVSDGKYVAVGTVSDGFFTHFLLDKYSRDKSKFWNPGLQFGGNFIRGVAGIRELSSGDLAIAGTQSTSGVVIKTDSDGGQVWTYLIDNSVHKYTKSSTIEDIDVDKDGNIVLLGVASFTSGPDAILFIKLRDNGSSYTELIHESYPCSGQNLILGSSGIQSSADGQFVYVATTAIPVNGVILKLNAQNGDEIWRNTHFSGQRLYDVTTSSDGNSCYSVGESDQGLLVVKISSSNGALEDGWPRNYNGIAAYGVSTVRGSDEIVLTGTKASGSSQAVAFYKIAADGTTVGSGNTYDGQNALKDDSGFSITQTGEGGFLIAGNSFQGADNHSAAYLIKVKPDGTFN